MTMTIGGTSGLVFPDSSTQNTAATGFGFKNRIINGAMVIDQRNAGAAWGTSINGYTVDRWASYNTVLGKVNGGQNYNSVTPPIGFNNYIGIQSQSAYTVGANERFIFAQQLEGFNTADLGWGTANAKTVTLSFWVRSSLTGTFGGALRNSAADRSYPFSYTISSANTWEQKSITIAGDTTGTWLTTNGVGITLSLSYGTGSTFSGTAGAWAGVSYLSATGATSVVGTNGATFYITGVQLEKGSTATSFDYRPYGTELALCQRYYEVTGFVVQTSGATTNPCGYWKVVKRAQPTITISLQTGTGGAVGNFNNAYGFGQGFYQTVNNSAQSQSLVTGDAEL